MTTNTPSREAYNANRRFNGVAQLYGKAALSYFRQTTVAVVGLGGVGSWAAEALARSGIGRLILIDFDHVALSNVNRQVLALEETLGLAKVAAMAARIRQINPVCEVEQIEAFADAKTIDQILAGADAVIEAADEVRAKVAIARWCHTQQVSSICMGAAGGKTDPLRIRLSDLSKVIQDPLLAKVRNTLRREHGFPRASSATMGILCVSSDEPMLQPAISDCHVNPTLAKLQCHGFGSSVCVTASLALVGVAQLLKTLSKPKDL